ncbi:hypothetical protein KR093_002040 [Drosophila rubida]|uniref:Uncharacterized protein n=1 Tax=Drosophila rubida TaxID=30044 RepID=A0AAD4JVR5_9MUSC|nr:hypothetical protein KR093_002040 [Drosophila rubida]
MEPTATATAAAATTTATTTATATAASLQRVASQASLVQAAPTHHYHYIQYPAHYLQQQQQQQQQCQCPCSCGRATTLQQQLPQPQPQPQQQQNGSMAVAVLVHQQTSTPAPQSSLKTQSAQSLLNHSYQALHDEEQQRQQSPSRERERLNLPLDSSVASCDCDLECTCPSGNGNANSPLAQQHKRSLLADAMLGADEITVSESDNNSTMIKKKKQRSSAGQTAGQLPSKSQPSDSCNDIYHDTELEVVAAVAAAAAVGVGGSKSQGIDDNRPPLPPRPPPRPRSAVNGSIAHRHGAGIKKYVVWCLICGGFSCLLGVLFLGVYFLLHSYTITVGNFETVPTFVPATLLILTGVCIMSLARRRNRYSYLIKLSGACGLVSALTCALVTVTTTVLHMSRLQALRECEYAQKTRTCTCYSDLIESQVDRVDKEGVRLVFDSLSDCGVVHGSLYSCLRAIFGLSVAGVLIAVFSCMLVYQLLSHERKKMYWEQLELRCRSLYASQAPPPHSLGALTAPGRLMNCRCCEQCHAHRQLTLPLQASAYPWDEASAAAAAAAAVAAGGAGAEQRFWATQPPGNFYSPNPGGNEELLNGSSERAARNNSSSGWSWPRMPWQRNTPDATRRFRQAAASPDSQYGFSSATAVAVADGNQMLIEEPTAVNGGAYNALPPPNALPYGVWGPPPPYSDPNSPARRGYYQYLQAGACLAGGNAVAAAAAALMPQQLQQEQLQQLQLQQQQQQQQQLLLPQQQQARVAAHAATLERMDGLNAAATNGGTVAGAVVAAYKAKAVGNGEYENTHSDSDGCNDWQRDRCSNTLPTRKLKKRIIEAGAKSIGPQNNATAQRPNVQQLFAKQPDEQQQQQLEQTQTVSGVENSGYQDSNGAIAKGQAAVLTAATTTAAAAAAAVQLEAAESEVYFADVSSCCNMSVKNDNYYDNATQQQQQQQRHPHQHQHQHQHSNCSHSSSNLSNNNEDYLAQRFGRREHSIRSRLPIPQSSRLEDDDDYESSNLNMPTLKSAALEKDISRQSMCSVESEAKTEFTDLSPSTPCTLLPPPPASFASDAPPTVTPTANFVASFPYSSESQCLEAHRRSTKNIHELLLAGNAGGGGNEATHYEIINDRERYQLQQRSSGNNKHKSKSKSRSREQLDIYGAGAERADWSDSSGCAALRGSSKRL